MLKEQDHAVDGRIGGFSFGTSSTNGPTMSKEHTGNARIGGFALSTNQDTVEKGTYNDFSVLKHAKYLLYLSRMATIGGNYPTSVRDYSRRLQTAVPRDPINFQFLYVLCEMFNKICVLCKY